MDTNNAGSLDVSGFGEIFDVVGVSDSTGDNSTLYSLAFSFGSSILSNGINEPEGVFRAGSDGDFFQHVGGNLFDSDGNAFDPTEFNSDPFATTFGTTNPSLIAVPEPSTLVFLGFAGLGLGLKRRRPK